MLAGSLALVIAIASNAAAAVPKEFFGVMPQGPLTTADYEAMGDAKVGTLRFELYWGAIDPSPAADDYNWAASDEVVTNAAKNGVGLLAVVSTAPAWVLALDGHQMRPGHLPSVRAQGQCRARRLAGVPRRRGQPLRSRRRVLDPESDPAEAADPRLADLERAELAELLEAEAGREGICEAARLRP